MTGHGRRPVAPFKFLVGAQIALCLACMIATGLFARSLAVARATDVGFEPASVVVASLSLRGERFGPGRGLRLIAELLERIDAVTGVSASTVATHVPFWDDFNLAAGAVVPESQSDTEGAPGAIKAFVGARYFETLELPILSGRGIIAADREGAAPVAVLSASLASALWWPWR